MKIFAQIFLNNSMIIKLFKNHSFLQKFMKKSNKNRNQII